MKRLTPLIFVMLLSTGCETALRAPICDDGNREFPAAAEGRYRMSMSVTDPAYSGAMVGLGELEFIIKAQPEELAIDVYGGDLKLVKKGVRALARLAGAKSGSNAKTEARAPSTDGDLIAWMPLDVCKVGDIYYSQTYSDDTGTYSVSRFDLAPDGITTVSLSFDPAEMEKNGFQRHFMPGFASFSDGEWNFDSVSMIVDNAGLSPERREKLLALAHPGVLGMVFSRVPEPSSFFAKGKPVLSVRIPRSTRIKSD